MGIRTTAVVTALMVVSAFGPASGQEPAAVQSPAPAPAEEATTTRRGPRDPFRPFNLGVRSKKDKPKTPLEQYDIGSLTLVAIIWNMANPKAMVEDDAGLGYTIGIGTPIGQSGGVVRKIEPDRVIIEEEFVDFYGEKKKKETVLELKPEGEKRP